MKKKEKKCKFYLCINSLGMIKIICKTHEREDDRYMKDKCIQNALKKLEKLEKCLKEYDENPFGAGEACIIGDVREKLKELFE